MLHSRTYRTMPHTRAEQEINRVLGRERLRSLLLGVVLTVIMAGVLYWRFLGRTLRQVNDEENTPLKQSMGRVVSVLYPPAKKVQPDPPELVSVQIDKDHLAQTYTRAPVGVGQDVRIYY